MKTLFLRFIFENWQRKLVSLILAMIIWLVVNHSMTVTKTVHGVPVRVINLPAERTIEGMQVNGILNNKLSITITGIKSTLDEMTGKDLEVILDAEGMTSEWIASITRKNLISLNPEIDLTKAISKISPVQMIVRPSNLVSERIPILIMQPIGEAPRGYQFLDVWPYQLMITINGPEETVKEIKARGLKLTFNLNEITKEELDALAVNEQGQQADEVSFFVPNSWKKIMLPQLSETPLEIDDLQAKALRIDFSRQDMLPIGSPIPISVFFPPKFSSTLNPETYTLGTNSFIQKKNGIRQIVAPLFAQGVSRLFLDIVKDMLQVVIIASPAAERKTLLWNAQFMYPHELENRYVAKVMSDANDDLGDLQPHLREDYLRNRFRSYMNRFRLYTPNQEKLSLKIELQANAISVTPTNM